MLLNIPFIVVILLIGIGLLAVLYKKNIIKMIIGIQIMETGVNLFLITLGYKEDSIAPIFTSAPEKKSMVFPTVQALTLTSIVIGVATTALMLSFAMLIYKHNKSLSTDKMRRLRG